MKLSLLAALAKLGSVKFHLSLKLRPFNEYGLSL